MNCPSCGEPMERFYCPGCAEEAVGRLRPPSIYTVIHALTPIAGRLFYGDVVIVSREWQTTPERLNQWIRETVLPRYARNPLRIWIAYPGELSDASQWTRWDP